MLKNVPTYVSLFVAACALSISIWQGYEVRKHNRLSVKPRLNFYIESATDVTNHISLINSGTGPAVIQDITIFIDGLAVPYGWEDALIIMAVYHRLEIRTLVRSYTYSKEDAIIVGKMEPLIVFEEKTFSDNIYSKLFRTFLRKIKLVVIYKSIYGEMLPPSIYEGEDYEDNNH